MSFPGSWKMGRLGAENALVNAAMRRVLSVFVAIIVDEVCANSSYTSEQCRVLWWWWDREIGDKSWVSLC